MVNKQLNKIKKKKNKLSNHPMALLQFKIIKSDRELKK